MITSPLWCSATIHMPLIAQQWLCISVGFLTFLLLSLQPHISDASQEFFQKTIQCFRLIAHWAGTIVNSYCQNFSKYFWKVCFLVCIVCRKTLNIYKSWRLQIQWQSYISFKPDSAGRLCWQTVSCSSSTLPIGTCKIKADPTRFLLIKEKKC